MRAVEETIVKLYDCKTAPSPRRVRIFIAEKGIDVDTVEVDLSSGEQFGETFRALNPDCTVPVLELDDGSCLTEVMGISAYLDAAYPEPPLFGQTPAERGEVLGWNQKVEQQGLLAMAEAFRNAVPGLKGRALPGPEGYEQIPALVDRGRARVLRFFETLDKRLAETMFIAGERYSVADISALVFVDFARRGKLVPDESLEHLARWYKAVSERPSARV